MILQIKVGLVMIALFIILFSGIAFLTVVIGKANVKKKDVSFRSHIRTRRCPYCGSLANVSGNHWECPFCGDSGVC